MAPDPDALAFEAEYWKQVMDAAGTITDIVPACASRLGNAWIACIALEPVIRTETEAAAFERLLGDIRAALALLKQLGEPVDVLIACAAGRVRVMQDAIAELTGGPDAA